MKKWLSIIIACMLLVTACSSGGTTSNPGSAPAGGDTVKKEEPKKDEPKKPVKLTMSIWGNDNHKKMYEEMATQFKEKNPHVTVEIVAIPFAEYQQKLSIMLASKTAPDIAWIAERMVPQFLGANQFEDLTSLKQDAAYQFDDFYPSTMEMLTKDGKVYGIPFSTPPTMLWYNKTMFKEKGLKTPMELHKEGKWNYDEFRKAAKALTNKEKAVYGARLFANWKIWSEAYINFLWGFGGDLFSKDGTKFTFNSPEGQKAVQLVYDMTFVDESAPKPGDVPTFQAGKVAMLMGAVSFIGTARQIKDFEWDVAPLPQGPANGPILGGFAGYTVLKGTENAADAKEFLKFISSKESMKKTATFFVPSRKSVLESEEYKKIVELPSDESRQIALFDQMKKMRTMPVHKNWVQIENAVQVPFEFLYTQKSSVADVLKLAEKEAEPLMK